MHVSTKDVNGVYNIVHLSKKTTKKTSESKTTIIELNKNLKKLRQYIEFKFKNDIYYGVMIEGYDNYQDARTLQFSAMNKIGETIMGIKIK